MTAPLLHIQQLAILGAGHWLAMSFSGPYELYMALIASLKAESYRNCYWQSGFFKPGGQGAWILAMFLVPRYADRFDNLQTKLAELQATEKGCMP